MNPNLLLGIVAALLGVALKTTLAFGVCLVLSWLADSPNRRFTVWLSFLYGAAACWLWMAKSLLAGGVLHASAAPVQAASSTAGAFEIPRSWAFPLGLGLRAAGIAYLLVLAYILFVHIRTQRQLKWILRFTTKPPAEIAALFQSLSQSLYAGRARLLVLSGVASPATFGWIRPTILLPDVCLQQDRSELEDILRHELHHVRRWDFVWNEFAVVCRALLFFHPAAWYALRKMQFERELACDLAVVSDSPGRRAKYAECLVHFARLNSSQDPRAWGIDFAASSSHLKARVQSILTGSRKPSIWLLGLRATCGLAFLIGFLGVVPSLAVLLSYAHQQPPQPLTSMIAPSHSDVQANIRPPRRRRLSIPRNPASGDIASASANQIEAAEPISASSGPQSGGLSSTQNGSGPQLLHRRSPSDNSLASAGNGTKQQTVALIDPNDSDEVSKTAGRDKKQALQQAVTAAAGIYKRIGAVDRH